MRLYHIKEGEAGNEDAWCMEYRKTVSRVIRLVIHNELEKTSALDFNVRITTVLFRSYPYS